MVQGKSNLVPSLLWWDYNKNTDVWNFLFSARANKYQYSELFICLLCFSFCATWFIIRRQPYAFILLDIINMALCMHVLKCLRLPSLKWISILMMCMFVYDAAMVFGTPYITPNGCSVMLEGATGLSCASREKTKGYPIPPVEQESVPEKVDRNREKRSIFNCIFFSSQC